MAITPSITPQPDLLKPMSPAQLDALANSKVDAAIAALKAPIDRAKSDAAQQALADQTTLAGVGAAGANMLTGIGPQIQGAYSSAGKDLAGLVDKFSTGVQTRVQAGEDANRAFVDANAPGSDHAGAPNAQDIHDTLYGLGGYVPASSLLEQGAAAGRWGAVLPGVQELQTQEDVRSRQAQSTKEQHDYEQQLIDLAAKRPDLRNQVVDELWKQELDKLNARLNVDQAAEQKRQHDTTQAENKRQFDLSEAEKKREYNTTQAQNARELKIRERAQALYEKQFNEKVSHNTVMEGISLGSLKLRTQKQQHDLVKAVADGAKPNAALSKVYGFIVDGQGQPILDASGDKIAVATKATAKDKQKVYGQAVGEAKTLRGKPVTNTDQGPLSPGKYIARPGAKGVFPADPSTGVPATTNNVRLAQKDTAMNFAEAQAYLMDKYGLTRQKARAALVASGWKPDGQRPGK